METKAPFALPFQAGSPAVIFRLAVCLKLTQVESGGALDTPAEVATEVRRHLCVRESQQRGTDCVQSDN